MYVQSQDNITMLSSNFSKITMLLQSGGNSNLQKTTPQMYLKDCIFSQYTAQTAIVVDIPSTYNWLFNTTMEHCLFHNCDNNKYEHGLIVLKNGNRNTRRLSHLLINNCQFLDNSDVFSIVENNAIVPSIDNGYWNRLEFYNVNCTRNKGTVLYHIFDSVPSHEVLVYSSHWFLNNQTSTSVTSSQSLIMFRTFVPSSCGYLPFNSSQWSSPSSFINRYRHLLLKDSTFDNNMFDNGIMDVFCSVVHLQKSVFTKNQGSLSSLVVSHVSAVFIDHSQINRNTGKKYGCIFDGNANGGWSLYTAIASNFTNNKGKFGGVLGFYYNDTARPIVNVANSTFFSNLGMRYMFFFGTKIRNLTSGTSSLKDVGLITIDGSTFTSNIAAYGGALFVEGIFANCTSSRFVKNKANRTGGAIVANSPKECPGLNASQVPVFKMSHLYFGSNTGPLGGAVVSNCYILKLLSSILVNNTATYRGGGIVSHVTCLQIKNTTFSQNQAAYGGAIAMSELESSKSCDSSISGSILFEGNSASFGGGAIHINQLYVDANLTAFNGDDLLQSQSQSSASRLLDIDDTQFLSNEANQFGGAIGVSRHWTDKTEDSGIYVSLQPQVLNIMISNTEFIENQVVETTNDELHGGGAIGWVAESLSESNLNVWNTRFRINKGQSQGGGLFITSFDCLGDDVQNNLHNCSCQEHDSNFTASLFQTTFTANTALLGGAISSTAGLTKVVNNTIEQQKSTYGGGMALRGRHEIQSTRVLKNDASDYGGGAYVGCVKNVIFQDTTFEGNTAQVGAGMFIANVDDINVQQATWTNNTASISGGALGLGVTNLPNITQAWFNNQFFDNNNAMFGPVSYISTHKRISLLHSSTPQPLTINMTSVHYTFQVEIDNDYSNIKRLYIVLSSSVQFKFKEIYSWQNNQLRLLNSSSQPVATISQFDLGYPHVIVMDTKPGVTFTDGQSLSLNLQGADLIDFLDLSNVRQFNISFKLFGVVFGSSNTDQTIASINFNNITAVRNIGYGMGGSFMDNNFGHTTISINNSIFNQNYASGSTVGTFWSCGLDMTRKANIKIERTRIVNNTAGLAISGISSKCAYVSMKDVTFDYNKCNGYAVNGHFQYSRVDMQDVVISNSVALLSGGIWIEYSSCNMDGCTFNNNTATTGYGACMYITRSASLVIDGNAVSSDPVLNLKNSKFVSNKCKGSGGCIYINTDYEIGLLNNTIMAQTFAPTPSPVASAVAQRRRTMIAQNESDCDIKLIIHSDTMHSGDISWQISGNSGTFLKGAYKNSTCFSTNESCLTFTMNDAYGDGLNYGEGTWSIQWTTYTFVSPSLGNYGPSETVKICRPDLWINTKATILIGSSIESTSGLTLLSNMKKQLFGFLANRLVVNLAFENLFTKYPENSNTECIRAGRYCYPEEKGGNSTIKHILAILCLWSDPSLSSTLDWKYFWNVDTDVTITNNAVNIINKCSLVSGSLTADAPIAVLNTSITFNTQIHDVLPLVTLADGSEYNVSDVSNEFAGWNNKSAACTVIKASPLVSFVCKAFSDIYQPFICQSNACKNWGFDTEDIVLQFNNGTSFTTIPSKPLTGTNYYSLKNVVMTVLVLNSSITDCDYSNQTDWLSLDEDIIFISGFSGKCNRWKFLERAEAWGIRGVILAPSPTPPPTPRVVNSVLQYIKINGTMHRVNETTFKTMEQSISTSLNNLLVAKTKDMSYHLATQQNTIDFWVFLQVNDTTTPYANLQQSVLRDMLSNAVLYQLQSNFSGNFTMSFNNLSYYLQTPTMAPTTSPTTQPTTSNYNIHIPVRLATSIPHNFEIKNGKDYSIDMSNGGAVVTTVAPTGAPTIPARQNNSQSGKKEVGFELYTDDSTSPRNYLEFPSRGTELYIGFDTLFETIDSFCLFYEGGVLQPQGSNKTQILNVSNPYEEIWWHFEPINGATSCSINLVFPVNGLTQGSYCLAVHRPDSSRPYHSVLVKRVYDWIKPNIQMDNCNFESNIAEGDGGAIQLEGLWNVSNYLSVSIVNSRFENNHGGTYGGAVSGFFGVDTSVLPYMGVIDLNNVTIQGNSAKYGGGVAMSINNKTQWSFKSVVRLVQGMIFNNSASSHGGGVYVDWGNLQLIKTSIIQNNAGQNGGGTWIYGAVFTSSHVLFKANRAAGDGGGHYRELYPITPNLMCMGFFYTNLTYNVANRGGAFFWVLYGKTDKHQADCTLFLQTKNRGNSATLNGPDGFLQIVEGDNPITNPNSLLSGFCSSETAGCETFTSSAKYLCIQTVTVDKSGQCEKANSNSKVIEKSTLYDAVVHFNMTPGAFVLLQVYGWDAFGNLLLTPQYDIFLKGNDPVTVTSKAAGPKNESFVFPLFVASGNVGRVGTADVMDPNNLAVTQQASVTVINCFPGYFQKNQTSLGTGIFTCTPCNINQYTLKNAPCRQCEIGCKCNGFNLVTVQVNWYGIESDEGYLATQMCPAGYCCHDNNGCSFSNKSSLCATGRDPSVPLCGKCSDGLSETTSPSGMCKVCTDNSGLTKQIGLAFAMAFALVGLFFILGARQVQKTPMPLVTYTSKSALFVFQLIPYLTFQQTSAFIEPLARAANLRMDFATSKSGDCVLKDMDGRTKLYLELLPSAVAIILLILVYVGMTLFRYIKLGKQPIPARFTNGFNSAVWNVCLTLYAQVASTLIKLISCRPVTGHGLRMYYAGAITCYDQSHFAAFAGIFIVGLFPLILYAIMLRDYRIGGHLYLQIRYPSLVLMYRKNTWWYVSYALLRRLFIIVIASIPASSSEVTSTFLAVAVGMILAIQLFIMPMASFPTNVGESYVWFIALAITLFNIKLEAPDSFKLTVSILSLGLFFLLPYFIYLLILDKISVIPTLDSNEAKEIDAGQRTTEAGSPRSLSIHKSGIMLDDDGRKSYNLPFNQKLTLLKKAPLEEGELPRGAIYTDTIQMAENVRDKFAKKHYYFRGSMSPKRKKSKKSKDNNAGNKHEKRDTVANVLENLENLLSNEEENISDKRDTIDNVTDNLAEWLGEDTPKPQEIRDAVTSVESEENGTQTQKDQV
ncbi:hypothetical protein RFI_11210 [Reticulomyxa filosa]|uniref:Adhesin-like protein n=1 Tax=Reticulomyxa filosa TaxID=46433 RepID=X6NKP6_RETFI|nr:hypothetical protein RFI_11210 [Reticulomyxa filosa]|eukprot:ETO25927.1 hypothetical protein RFI_11210 [Reticulomyxa filosa]